VGPGRSIRHLCHGAELLSLLDHQLSGQVLLAECLVELQTSDESWVRVAGGVIVTPRLGRTIQLVRGDGDTLLAGIDSEVELGPDYPQPVVGIERLDRVADGGGLQADEPLDFFVRSSPGGHCGSHHSLGAPWLPPSSASAESAGPSRPPSWVVAVAAAPAQAGIAPVQAQLPSLHHQLQGPLVAVAAARPRPCETSSSLAASSKRASRRPDLRIDNLLENMTREAKL
jgi:hypothetical protein